MDKVLEVKQKLAIYANEHAIPTPAVSLMETLIENNVSYAAAEQFCEEHFINSTIANYYKNFYKYIADTKVDNIPTNQISEIAEVITAMREQLDKLEQLLV